MFKKINRIFVCLLIIFNFGFINTSEPIENSILPSAKFINLVNSIYKGENIYVFKNGRNITDDFLATNRISYYKENFIPIYNYVIENSLTISDYSNTDFIELLNSNQVNQSYNNFNSVEVTVKMYFAGEHYFLRTTSNPPYTTVEMSVLFYTYARFHTITGNVLWADRPYIEYVEGNLNGGLLSSGNGGTNKSISGVNVSYSNTWVVPVVRWTGYQNGQGYSITLAYPSIYYPYNNQVFTPRNWWDGGGVISKFEN